MTLRTVSEHPIVVETLLIQQLPSVLMYHQQLQRRFQIRTATLKILFFFNNLRTYNINVFSKDSVVKDL